MSTRPRHSSLNICETSSMRHLISLCLLLALARTAYAENWNQFRGESEHGHSSAQLPVRWGEELNLGWKTAIHGKAWSSPVVWASLRKIVKTSSGLSRSKSSALCAFPDFNKAGDAAAAARRPIAILRSMIRLPCSNFLLLAR